MPYTNVAPSELAVNGAKREKGEEARVERISGGKVDMKNGISHDIIRSISIQPPTPERETPPSPSPIHLPIVSADATLPRSAPTSTAAASIPLQVLPEVRSPPRRSLAMAADSLQLNLRRGRRPRLFGFTEIPDSSDSASSAASSVNNSRNNSPERERVGTSPLGLSSVGAGPSTSSITPSNHGPGYGSGDTLPRRGPIRARSDTHLPTISSSMSTLQPNRVRTTSADDSHVSHTPSNRRTRENGLKLDFTGITPLNQVVDSSTTYIPSPYSAKLIRKKSGELVKPALKYIGPLTAGGTPITEREALVFHSDTSGENSPVIPPSRRGSKSLPGTPSFPKAVHFDSQLERVKLFNKDHKPQVVSRNGSPTQYTTSEGEEFPFPSTDDEAGTRGMVEEKKVLSIKLPNFPSHPDTYSDLQLESLTLDETDRKTLRGVVIVRNFAFSKWVAVRFTFDWWQTTSEVSATHKETIRDGSYDRFAFQIKLGDMMNKIEEKTLFMCVRYNSEGREIWDSNSGQNYQVNFEKKVVIETASNGNGNVRAKRMLNTWGSGRDDGRMAGLREKLSRLTAEDDEADPPLSPNRTSLLSAGKRGVNFSFGGSPSSPRKGHSALASDNDPLQGIPNQGLAARYDFGTAFKGTRDGRSSSPDTRNAELPNVRTGLLAFENSGSTPNRHERPGMDFYSPMYSPSGLPESSTFGSASADLFSAPSPARNAMFDSPAVMSSGSTSTSKIASPLPVPASSSAIPTPLDVPDVTIQGPSPPPPDSPIATISASSTKTKASPIRPSLNRSSTSPAALSVSLPPSSRSPTSGSSKLQNNKPFSSPLSRPSTLPMSDPAVSRSPSPPVLATSSSATSTEASDSPRSPEQLGLSGMQEVNLNGLLASRERGSGDSMASYSSFIEQFCWGGGSTTSTPTPVDNYTDLYAPSRPSPPRRVHSSSSLDEYFAHGSASSGGSGFATPRPVVTSISPQPYGYRPLVPAHV